ncbi:papain-like cysteine protease family protein [Burkholderia pyrrocinia]|uniref:papain-like cysteine protease family protein n=1 Tax=Burkholderia pyrrocinia TaxID=60550 RepID=UPI001FC89EC6|nr:papain-like cysteine protease family protein [Burkholderia pyrrocinia]
MVDVRLNVGLVDQRGVKMTKSGSKEVKNACWYAAACMVSYYFRPGPRRGIPKLWQADQGLPEVRILELCAAEGLVPLDQPDKITPEWLAAVLTDFGPIWAAGHFLDEPGHVIVITGIQHSVVHYNDPEGPPARTMLLGTLDSGRWKPDGLLVKDQSRY